MCYYVILEETKSCKLGAPGCAHGLRLMTTLTIVYTFQNKPFYLKNKIIFLSI